MRKCTCFIEKLTIDVWIDRYELFERLLPSNGLLIVDNVLDHKTPLASYLSNLIRWKALKFRELDLGDELVPVR